VTLGERIDGWPWVKTIALVGVWSFIATQVTAGAVTVALLLLPKLRPAAADAFLLDRALRLYEQATDGSLWCMGAGALGIVGKRATTKSSVIDAETKAAVVTGRVPEATPDMRQTEEHVATATAAAQGAALPAMAASAYGAGAMPLPIARDPGGAPRPPQHPDVLAAMPLPPELAAQSERGEEDEREDER
jgi:hypothetical protein